MIDTVKSCKIKEESVIDNGAFFLEKWKMRYFRRQS